MSSTTTSTSSAGGGGAASTAWTNVYGTPGGTEHEESVRSMVSDGAGTIWVVGDPGQTNFGGGIIGFDAYVLGLDAATGAQKALRSFGPAAAGVSAVVATSDGDVVIAGSFSGTLELNGKTLTSAAGQSDIFIAKLSSTLDTTVWARDLGGPGGQDYHLAAGPQGGFAIAGQMQGPMDFGNGVVTPAGNATFIARFDADGTLAMSRVVQSSTGGYGVNSVAIDGAKNTLLAGMVVGSIDLGAGTVMANGTSDAAFLKLGSGGSTTFQKVVGTSGFDNGLLVVAGPSNSFYAVGAYTGALDLGQGPVNPKGDMDLFIVKSDAGGSILATKTLGTAGASLSASRGSLAPDGDLAIGGGTQGLVDLGGGMLGKAAPGMAGYALRLDKDLGYRDSVGLVCGSDCQLTGVVAGPGAMFIGATARDGADLGDGPLATFGMNDILVARVEAPTL